MMNKFGRRNFHNEKELTILVNQMIVTNAERLGFKFISNTLEMSGDGIHPAPKTMFLLNRFISKFASDSKKVRSFLKKLIFFICMIINII